jgi:ribonuclease P protein component
MLGGQRGASAWPSRSIALHFASSTMAGFPRAARLRSGEDFKRGLSARRRASGRWFTATVAANESGRARLGVVVGRKMLPQATGRNRIKRVTRERFRALAPRLGAVDVLVRLRAKLNSEDMPAAEAEVERLLRGLA